jgi:hypothetical protein
VSNSRRCPQCNRDRDEQFFRGKRKALVQMCDECRERRVGGVYQRVEPRRSLRKVAPEPRVIWSASSNNQKLGRIGAAIVTAETCPPSCSFYGNGCYAELGQSRRHWARAERFGLRWDDFLTRIRELAAGVLWRYGVSGDLPGMGEELDHFRLRQLVVANRGKRGFAFTHKRLLGDGDLDEIRWANEDGFAINLSAEGLEHADERAALGIAPVAVVVPHDAPSRMRTPAGRPVFVCPAQTTHTTCADCQLCSRSKRTGIVAFRAHGSMKGTVGELVKRDSGRRHLRMLAAESRRDQ